MSDLQNGIEEMNTKKESLQKREKGLVKRLEEVQRDLESFATM